MDWRRRGNTKLQSMVVVKEIVMEWFTTRRSYERGMREMGRLSRRNENGVEAEVRRKREEITTRGMVGGIEEETEAVIDEVEVTTDERGVEIDMMIETETGEGVEIEMTSTGPEVDGELPRVNFWLSNNPFKGVSVANRPYTMCSWLL